MVLDRGLVEQAMLEGGPMHGMRRVLEQLATITLPQFGGRYHRVGRNEAGIAMFKWRKESHDRTET